MKHIRIVTVLAGLLLAAPVPGFAQAKHAAAPKAKPVAAATVSTARGIVKSSDTTSLVITLPGAKAAEQTFVLDSSTKRHGDLVAGASVNVHYRVASDGTKVATAVDVRSKKKEPAAAKAKAGK